MPRFLNISRSQILGSAFFLSAVGVFVLTITTDTAENNLISRTEGMRSVFLLLGLSAFSFKKEIVNGRNPYRFFPIAQVIAPPEVAVPMQELHEIDESGNYTGHLP